MWLENESKYIDQISGYKTRNGDVYKTCILSKSVIALANMRVGAMNSHAKRKGQQQLTKNSSVFFQNFEHKASADNQGNQAITIPLEKAPASTKKLFTPGSKLH